MRAHTQPPSKTGVTRVTRVTPLAKCPVSLALTPVTQFSSLTYMRCNAAPACNAKASARPLRAKRSEPMPTKRLSLVKRFESRAWDSPLLGTDDTLR